MTDACSLVILISRIELASNDEKMQSIWTKYGEGAQPSSSHYETRNRDGEKVNDCRSFVFTRHYTEKKFPLKAKEVYFLYMISRLLWLEFSRFAHIPWKRN